MMNKGADQTARMRRLICTFVVHIWHKTRFHDLIHFIPLLNFLAAVTFIIHCKFFQELSIFYLYMYHDQFSYLIFFFLILEINTSQRF